MNKPILLLTFGVGSLLLCAVGEAQAQYPPTTRGVPSYNYPTYSPYLNLNRRGGTTTQNYFGLVRPELDFRQNLLSLNQQTATNQQSIAELGNQLLPATGHNIMFNNTSHYFGNLQGSGGGGGGGGRATSGTGQRAAGAGGASGRGAPRQ
jgi:hypothetical protein